MNAHFVIDRDLNVHRCAACQAALTDGDFVHIGISVERQIQYFFDYHCPRCNDRGRHAIELASGILAEDAIVALLEFAEVKINAKGIDWNL